MTPFALRLFFYSGWIVLLLVQAFFTELSADEAYYWYYSTELSWGYFDHPPLIALLIKTGHTLFSNELGVRLFSILLSAGTIFIVEKIIKPENIKFFYLLVSSIGILHFVGFYAIPDSPLLFFTALFLFIYQSYLKEQKWVLSLFMGLIAALMILSKYHAFVILFLVLIGNFKWILNRHFWWMCLIACLVLIPHFLWQMEYGFPSVKYHLFERNKEEYSINFTLHYLITQLFIFGPVSGILFLIAARKFKITNLFERALRFLFWGGFLFFLLMSFRGKIEGHWTVFTVIPAIYFGYKYFKPKGVIPQKWITLFVVSYLLIFSGRIWIISDFNFSTPRWANEFLNEFKNKEDMQLIKKQAGDLPVAFMNSYQKASLYTFYSGSTGFSLNSIMGRKNQFDIWNFEERLRGKTIMIVPNFYEQYFRFVEGTNEKYQFEIIRNFQTFTRIRISPAELSYSYRQSESVPVRLKINDTGSGKISFATNPDFPSVLYYQFFKGKNMVKEDRVFQLMDEMINQEVLVNIQFPKEKGNYGLFFTIKTGWIPHTINSERFSIEIE